MKVNMTNVEIKMPIINNNPKGIQKGQLVYIEKKELHIHLWGKFRKYRWYHKFIFKKPVEYGIVQNIDTSKY